jgi:hypothetical protein
MSKEERDRDRDMKKKKIEDFDADDYDVYCHLITHLPEVTNLFIFTF